MDPVTSPAFSAPALVLARKSAGLTRAQLAQSAQLDRTQLWRIETGRVNPYDSTVGRLADALGISVRDLLAAPAIA